MIRNFRDSETLIVYQTGRSRKFGAIARAAARRLGDIDFARAVEELREPPGNRLEKLKGNREGQWSIRINDQYRICFRWEGTDALDVEIVDCH
jgi:toxin HigB-1